MRRSVANRAGGGEEISFGIFRRRPLRSGTEVRMQEERIRELVRKQRAFFAGGRTYDFGLRKAALCRLRESIRKREDRICRALREDLGKTEAESYLCEVGMALREIGEQLRHLETWGKPRRVPSGLACFPAKSRIVPQPYGTVLIMAPWNYPFLLTMQPLAGALAAGNCCVVKPSAYSPHTSSVIAEILRECFPEKYAAAVTGGREENRLLLEERFDYIFFTGSVSVGKFVMEKAAAHLTPVTLELGGKSPCAVDRTADLSLAARRIAFGKFLNCGQTCVAPDYVLIEECVREKFLTELRRWIRKMYGENPLDNPAWGNIVNPRHFARLCGLLDPEKTVCGGGVREETLQIAPTVLSGVAWEDPVMREEIFGPILPVLSVRNMAEAMEQIAAHPHPLASYVFTRDPDVERRFVRYVQSGGCCVNDTVLHLASAGLPFGGVGDSGMGSYHGKKSFETFSHEKGVLKRGKWPDVPVRYQPYGRGKLAAMKLLLR